MSYCLTRSLKMVLEARGDAYAEDYLECVSTEPFGFVYVRGQDGGIAVTGYEYHFAGERLLQALGYDYRVHDDKTPQAALARLRSRLRQGPVVVGMLDMGFLTYQPDHQRKRGSDHAIVALRLDDEHLIVHDADGYASTPLSLGDFLQAWRAEGIYTGKRYMQWEIGVRRRQPPAAEIYRRALELGLENLRRASTDAADGSPAPRWLHGPIALTTLAADLRARRTGGWLRRYSYFSFRVSAQRCFDGAGFIRAAPFANPSLEQAAQLRLRQAEEFGQAQLAAAHDDPEQVAQALERLAILERDFTLALERGLNAMA